MRAMRLVKAVCAGLSSGVLLQVGGCDSGALAPELLTSVGPQLFGFALSALMGGVGV